MQLPIDITSLPGALQRRRQQLAARIDLPVILWSGGSPSRNFPANRFPFRASSHFLYFAGLGLENAAIRLEAGKLQLFINEPSPEAALWHGSALHPNDIAAFMGADSVHPLSELAGYAQPAVTIPVQDQATLALQVQVLKRDLPPAQALSGGDHQLAAAIVDLRLTHDQLALSELRQAGQVTIAAHLAGMAHTPSAKTEAEVRAAMESVLTAADLPTAYASIVTVHGQVLHNTHYGHSLQAGDLLLADVGGETATGWAADITRTWPVSGQFSASQRAIYELVLAAHDACIAALRPGVEYRQIHLLAAQTIAAGLVELGILRGNPQSLVERDAHALFFPHGIGHLLGLDVHDMEDLGDLAGYAPGRQRSDRFGLGFLRLDRPLQAGMVVTIEPGFYQVPAILEDSDRRSAYQDCVNWQRLADFADVRGIRIEDDVLITDQGCEVLTAALPTDLEQVEALVSQSLCNPFASPTTTLD
ncbi:MAG: aminopeptidase P family protein [Aphanocapsa sp. GSE-SYN-MK-11-07L]|jgi:Xaa-Pro aminopeptidase/Xaa-Pro dipeptidase|nr:aminopeptidase P family protein [Aphanocapsa sp. GSE-SYN-MK-11-07L]